MSDPKTQQEPSMEEILASIRRIISEDGSAKSDVAEPEEAQEEDVLELTEVVEPEPEPEEDEPEPEEEEEPAFMSRPAAFDEPESEAEEVEEEEREEVDFPLPARSSDDDFDGPLVSEHTEHEAENAFRKLIKSETSSRFNSSGDLPLGGGDKTLETITKELLRPMLRQWLDDNLPEIVERAVRREVERLSRR